jgi:hypothetical protein
MVISPTAVTSPTDLAADVALRDAERDEDEGELADLRDRQARP